MLLVFAVGCRFRWRVGPPWAARESTVLRHTPSIWLLTAIMAVEDTPLALRGPDPSGSGVYAVLMGLGRWQWASGTLAPFLTESVFQNRPPTMISFGHLLFLASLLYDPSFVAKRSRSSPRSYYPAHHTLTLPGLPERGLCSHGLTSLRAYSDRHRSSPPRSLCLTLGVVLPPHTGPWL